MSPTPVHSVHRKVSNDGTRHNAVQGNDTITNHQPTLPIRIPARQTGNRAQAYFDDQKVVSKGNFSCHHASSSVYSSDNGSVGNELSCNENEQRKDDDESARALTEPEIFPSKHKESYSSVERIVK